MNQTSRARRGLIAATFFLIASTLLCAFPGASGSPGLPSASRASDRDVTANDCRADSTPDLRLVLNIPAFRLDVFERDTLWRSYGVATGMPRYRTPVGTYQIDHLVWNPWWRPPASEWARKERPHPPGWKNPVGRVKLHVHDLVFVHGSPYENSMGSAASHGCVRMRNADAMDLARLVHEHAIPTFASGTLDSLIADTSHTRTIALERTVPIDIRYDLAEVRGGFLYVYRDVYGYGGSRVPGVRESAIGALLQAGKDTAALRAEHLRAVIRSARRGSARMSLDSLFPFPPTVR